MCTQELFCTELFCTAEFEDFQVLQSSSSAGGPSETVWDSEAMKATCELQAYTRPHCSHRKKIQILQVFLVQSCTDLFPQCKQPL